NVARPAPHALRRNARPLEHGGSHSQHHDAHIVEESMTNYSRMLAAGLLVISFVGSLFFMKAGDRASAADATLPGTATLSGLVEAPAPFKAAQVHLMNVDKNILFMVYTSGGRYRAVNLFPGRYEVTVRKPGFAAEPRTITLAAGATGSLDF